MSFQRIKYSGRKPFPDRTSLTTWAPGDVKLVPEAVAKRLLKFLEFSRYVETEAAPVEPMLGVLNAATATVAAAQTGEPQDSTPSGEPADGTAEVTDSTTGEKPSEPSREEQEALAMQQAAEQAKLAEKQILESMLLTVEAMDKPALEEYARKYEVELDKRLGVVKLRAEVSTLIEQFGVR